MPDLTTLHATVDTWFEETLRCAPLSYDTPAYNQVHAARDDLKIRLSALFAPADTGPSDKGMADAPQTPAAEAAPEQE